MTRLTENQWIEYFGFQRFPFDRPEAGNEEFSRPDFLATCFVEPSSFERILGQADSPVTSLLFAARGTGKTACRVMVDYYCLRGEVNQDRRQDPSYPSYVLGIPHIYLHEVYKITDQKTISTDILLVRVEHHAEEILRRAVPALVNLVAGIPSLDDKLKSLSSYDRQDLSWLIQQYSHYLTASQISFLKNQGIIDTFPKEDLDHNNLPSFWITKAFQSRMDVSALNHIELWAKLMPKIGISATYVLIDGVDEFEETAANPELAFRVVKPLLTNLRLMDGTPYFALKFFLPDQIKPFIIEDLAIRHDRGFIIENIKWSQEDLIKILRKRLAALKREDDRDIDRLESGFGELCIPELRGTIEEELADYADGNPRKLMILCGLMVMVHCDREINNQDDPYQLNKLDWELARREFDVRSGHQINVNKMPDDFLIDDLIKQGESDLLEFKSSLRWDYRKGAINKGLQSVIAKTITGMLNAKGGVLLIGVSDDGSILGIEKDINGLSKPNHDGFQLLLSDIVRTYVGIQYLALLNVHFKPIKDKWVCVISVKSSSKPVYFNAGNTSEFYVRMGNSTRLLDVKVAMDYIQTNWKGN